MSPTSFLEYIINLTIKVFFYWFSHNLYNLIIFVAGLFGIHGILLDFEFLGSDLCAGGMMWVLYGASIFLWFVSGIFLWIFIFWMIIIIFVPHVIIIPIPIIPFVIPIPLKMVILENVPPFKLLTNRGILPFIRKIIFRFLFSEETIKNKFKSTFFDTYGFLYDEFKLILGDLLNRVIAKPEPIIISKDIQDDEYGIEIEQDEDNSKETADKEKSTENKKIQELINEELEVCLKSKQSFISSDLSDIEALYANIGNINNYADCYSTSIKAYIDNKL